MIRVIIPADVSRKTAQADAGRFSFGKCGLIQGKGAHSGASGCASRRSRINPVGGAAHFQATNQRFCEPEAEARRMCGGGKERPAWPAVQTAFRLGPLGSGSAACTCSCSRARRFPASKKHVLLQRRPGRVRIPGHLVNLNHRETPRAPR